MYETKDSGKRMEFSSGMKRDTQEGKTLYHLVFDGPLFERWAQLLTRGAEKYSPGNWLKAEGQAELDRFKASAVRHFIQWYRGDRDEDHAAAVTFNINGKEYVEGKMVFPGDEAVDEQQAQRENRLPPGLREVKFGKGTKREKTVLVYDKRWSPEDMEALATVGYPGLMADDVIPPPAPSIWKRAKAYLAKYL